MRAALVRAYMRLRQRPILRRLSEMEQSQWLPPERLAERQLRRTRDLLRHAARETAYYGALFRKAGFDPEIRSLENLRSLPPLDKTILEARFDDLKSRRAGRAVIRHTGGSTGRPVRVLVDEAELASRAARQHLSLMWLGWEPGRRVAFVWGSDTDAREHRGAWGLTKDRLLGTLWLDAFSLRDDTLERDLERLRRHDPWAIVGYPSSLALLAGRAPAGWPPPSLRGVQTSAETLSPQARERIERGFGRPVLDRYGCREAGIVAHECPEGSMHVAAESVLMETDGGEVLLTSLDNMAMPLIRYRNEDMAELSGPPCPCGRGTPVVRAILGRRSDIIRSPSGRLLHGEFFTHLFYGVEGVERFQVRQTSASSLIITTVSRAAFDAAARRRLEEMIRRHGDEAFEVTWRQADDLPSGASGKFRFTLSDLSDVVPPDRPQDEENPAKQDR
ncbi:MAG TPA: hypothetical protein VJV23_01875 [Candidatus Polarisedimenticolia bacterium]|nr:hypothetical protein [Candidatus Polarisedimenticolia bacterium]